MIDLNHADKQKMFKHAKHLWLSALFYNIAGHYPDIAFAQQKAIFFLLVREGLNAGIMKFDYPPLAEYAGKTGFWDADNETIVQYLQDNFPQHATHENDMDVNDYFYQIAPPVNWL